MIEWGESNYGGGLVYPRLESRGVTAPFTQLLSLLCSTLSKR
ncbi:MAG: hypothetical protein OIN86_11330 [Candidatus Methanoperedens sp.]|nr:hypothetical protein [Candidatus Methanoperedens sp.]